VKDKGGKGAKGMPQAHAERLSPVTHPTVSKHWLVGWLDFNVPFQTNTATSETISKHWRKYNSTEGKDETPYENFCSTTLRYNFRRWLA